MRQLGRHGDKHLPIVRIANTHLQQLSPACCKATNTSQCSVKTAATSPDACTSDGNARHHDLTTSYQRLTNRREWFTLCFIPIVPFSLKPWHEVGCHICNFHQDIKFRPDVEQQKNAGPNQIPMQPQGGNQGWQGAKPPNEQQPGNGGQMVYK